MIPAARAEPTPVLFPGTDDRRIAHPAQLRNFVGDFFEQCTAEMFKGVRLKTDSRCKTCPDVRVNDRTYVESKSVGNTGSAIVYAVRLDRDEQFVEQHACTLRYCVWRHSLDCTAARTLYELRTTLASSVVHVVVLPLSVLSPLLRATPLRTLNKGKTTPSGARLGYGCNGYGTGYSLPVRTLLDACNFRCTTPPIVAYGVDVAPVPMYVHAEQLELYGAQR